VGSLRRMPSASGVPSVPDASQQRRRPAVLHVMSRMLPSGTELQLAGMLRAARGRLWDPTLCVLYPGFPLATALADEGLEVVELDGSSRLHADRAWALRRLARSGRFDVVHTSLWGAGAFGRSALVGPHRPAVVVSERRVEDFRGRPQRALDRVLARATDEWIGNSRDVADFVVRAHGAPPGRVHVIRNGVDTTVFRPAQPGQERPPLDGRPARVGSLGRLVEQKGFDVLVDAVPYVHGKRDVEVVIAGDGELRADLERRANGLPVSFPGSVDGAGAVADYLRGLDLFVLPSRYEGLPNVVLEALACGVPVVATAVPGMVEATGSAARLVPPDDALALAEAVIESLDEPPRGTAPATRSFDDVAADHLAVFELAMHRRYGSCT
jgi:glycosyltransferase involved in cell wall biosynthesis